MAELIVLSGPSGSGKSTIAGIVQEAAAAQVISVREHYRNVIVPEYLRFHNLPEHDFSREITMAAADCIYHDDSAAYAKILLKGINLTGTTIIESLRIKGDLEYIHSEFPSAGFVYVSADFSTRVKRIMEMDHALEKNKTEDEIKASLEYEWNHFNLKESQEFLRGRALFIDTSGYYEGELPDGLFDKLKKYLEEQ